VGLIWGVLISLLGMAGAIVIAIVAPLISEDVKDWLSWIPGNLIRRAVSHLPEAERERLEEEWSSHVNDMPGALAKIYVAWLSVGGEVNFQIRNVGQKSEFRGNPSGSDAANFRFPRRRCHAGLLHATDRHCGPLHQGGKPWAGFLPGGIH